LTLRSVSHPWNKRAGNELDLSGQNEHHDHGLARFQPSLIGCYIWSENHNFEMIRKSKECVINIPTLNFASKVVGIGNTSGRDIDKFQHFGLTAKQGEKVKAPLIKECFANYECKLIDTKLIAKYSQCSFWRWSRRMLPSPRISAAPSTIAARASS
jgi:hypothetical protein